MAFDARAAIARLDVGGESHSYLSLPRADAQGLAGLSRLPWCLRVMAENVLRHAVLSGEGIDSVNALIDRRTDAEIRFRPRRVMMDDTAGLPLIGDLAALRDAAAESGGDPRCISLARPVDFIVDHSVIAEHAGTSDAAGRNAALEYGRNAERYAFLRWGAEAFDGLRVFPPGSGICHQINLEHLAEVVSVEAVGGERWLVPDTLAGIDSHTPMTNGLGIVGWGVPGMEGLAAALGEPLSINVPRVVGLRLTGEPRPGVLATDIVLTLVALLRSHGVVGKVVEYFGAGVGVLPVPDRATISNMTPETGATMSCFPVDAQTVAYLRATGRDEAHVARVEAYARAQGLWVEADDVPADYDETIEFDLSAVEPSLAGPRQPHARIPLPDAAAAFHGCTGKVTQISDIKGEIGNGALAIAAITSCTNTSNPAAMIAAGLLARNAVARGLGVPSYVKTSLSPGSRVVSDYLARSGLQAALDALGFHVAGYGCMTCVGFSGPLKDEAADAVAGGVKMTAVLSGNRNYDGRVHADVHSSFLASPPLVVAYALAGTMKRDLYAEAVAHDADGAPVRLADLWPSREEIDAVMRTALSPDDYRAAYARASDERWSAIPAQATACYAWSDASTVIRRPPLPGLDDVERSGDIESARVLAIFGDHVTTEHVSPMGPIPRDSEAASYLRSCGVHDRDIGTYAGRRLNHEVMIRGTFAAPQLVNHMAPGPGGMTVHVPSGERCSIHEASQRYAAAGTPLVVIAGSHYGTGSSRDWSAKGPRLLGVRAVIAVSFERIHRANLVAAGVLPLEFANGVDADSLKLDGTETITVRGISDIAVPLANLDAMIRRRNGDELRVVLTACLDTAREVAVYGRGGLLPLVFDRLVSRSK